MKKVVLSSIEVKSSNGYTRVQYNYSIPNKIQNLISDSQVLYVDYPYSYKQFKVPESILAIPFVGVMLSVSMLFDIEIVVPCIDKVFFDSLSDIQDAYNAFLPRLNVSINVKANKTETNHFVGESSSLFFTGGVDATSALIEKLDDKPLLINIWGGDINLSDTMSHDKLNEYFNYLTKSLGLQYAFVRSNARYMFDENKLNSISRLKIGYKNDHGWWASIAHILSMSTIIAPMIFINKISHHYVGSSYECESRVFDSNNTILLNAIKYADVSFYTVDDTLSRLQKAKKIVEFQKDKNINLSLKVCWKRKASENCCSCEKCYRTISGILLKGGDPKHFGFAIDKNTLSDMRKYLEHNIVNKGFWIPIQEEFKQKADFWNSQNDLAWILNIKINSPKVYFIKLLRKLRIVKKNSS